MFPATPALAAALDGSRAMAVRVTARDWTTGEVVLEVPVEDGTVALDLTSPHYASASLDLADHAQLPAQITDPLSGFGQTVVVVELGAYTSPDTPEFVTFPELLPAETRVSRSGDGTRRATLTCVSPSEWVESADLGQLTPQAGETVQAMAARIVAAALPFPITVQDTTTPAALDPEFTADADPWSVARALCEGVNLVAEMRGRVLVIRDPHTLHTPDHYWDTTDQVAAMDSELGRGGSFANRVRVTFDTPTGEVVGDAQVTTGTLRWGGPAGMRLLELDRPGPADPVMAQLFAVDLLATTSAAWRTQALDIRPDYRVTPGDTARLTGPGGTVDLLVTFTQWPLRADLPGRVGVRTDATGV